MKAIPIIGVLLLSFSFYSFQLKQTSKAASGSFQQHQFVVGETEREMGVFLPSNYNPDHTYPVVVVFHGGNGNMRAFARKTNWINLANEQQFIVAFMQAVKRCLVRNGQEDFGNYWLTSGKQKLLCAGDDRSDSDYLDVALSELHKNYNTKKDQIYAAGFSNGLGYILQNIITRQPNIFAAVGGSSSLIYEPLEGKGNLPVCIILGNEDNRFTKHSGKIIYRLKAKAIVDDPVQGACLEHLKDYLRVDEEMVIQKESDHIQLDFGPSMDCPNSYLRYQLLKGVGHQFPNGEQKSNGFDGAKILWDFFKAHQLPRE